GFAIAQALAQEGVAVMVNGRTRGRGEEAVARRRNSASAEMSGLAAALGAVAGVRRATARFPEVDILVTNLGIFEPKPFEQISDPDWFRFFEVNVMSGVRLSRHYLPR